MIFRFAAQIEWLAFTVTPRSATADCGSIPTVLGAKLTVFRVCHLEFFSIKIATGPLTSRLQHLNEGDTILPTDLDPANDHVMLCWSPHMLADVQAVLAERIFAEGNHSGAGHLVIEKAFVER